MEAKYLQNRKGVWYFRRRIPDDVRTLYPERRDVLFFSLKTRSQAEAARRAHEHALRQDALWKARRGDVNLLGPEERQAAYAFLEAYGLNPGDRVQYDAAGIWPDEFMDEIKFLCRETGQYGEPAYVRERTPGYVNLAYDLFLGEKLSPLFSEAVSQYQAAKREDPKSKKGKARWNAVNRFFAYSADRPVDRYEREEANGFVRKLLDDGNKVATVKRYLNYLTPVLRYAFAENGLPGPHVFENIVLPKSDSVVREPFTINEISQLQKICIERDDSLRWAVALISDTGLRLGEAIGLKVTDFSLGEVPYVSIRESDVRDLKTARSTREVPLVGAALWAAQRIVANTKSEYVWPKYAVPGDFKATSASNAIAKWVRAQGIDKTMHSLRHSIRDRLRDVNAPEEIIDQVGGWSARSAGQRYGRGASLSVKAEWLEKIVLDTRD
ncbi:Site-specific recombinase XerD [Celeribacter neptunius]|uniref:Site-specific recombinase XerD n=1 Tax=Celeribacter neptunius TaxID=588602 RepID=A0A1I3REJ4_9RHOB|nr:Site-specific recombinase XerD [Celeribacter neptunius]